LDELKLARRIELIFDDSTHLRDLTLNPTKLAQAFPQRLHPDASGERPGRQETDTRDSCLLLRWGWQESATGQQHGAGQGQGTP